jgi:hypothetical protein
MFSSAALVFVLCVALLAAREPQARGDFFLLLDIYAHSLRSPPTKVEGLKGRSSTTKRKALIAQRL